MSVAITQASGQKAMRLEAVSKPVAEVVRLLKTLETLTNSATEVAFEMGTSKLCSVKIYTPAQ